MPINIPNIDNINEVNPVYRDGIAAIFKCTRDGWVELLTQTRPAYVQSGTEYTPSPMSDSLCEMRTDGGNQHVYYNLSNLPKVPEVPVFTAFMFSRNFTEDAAASVGFSVCNWSGVKGWSMNTETYNNTGDTGVSKSGVADMPFSLLESANVETHLAIQFKSDNSAVGFTDEGTDTNSNTSGFKASGTNNRIVIGGAWRSAAFSGPSYSNIGPYVILWNKLLSADQITNLAANPALLKDPTLLSPMQVHNWLYLGAAGFTINCTLESLTLTENASDTDLDFTISSALESLSLTDNNGTVALGFNIAGNLESLTLTENASDTDLDFTISGTQEILQLTDNNGTVSFGFGINANTESLTLTENASDTDLDFTITSTLETLTLTENASNTDLDFPINCSLESLDLTDNNATVLLDSGFQISAGLESLELTDINSSITFTGSAWTIQSNDGTVWIVQANDSSSWTVQ